MDKSSTSEPLSLPSTTGGVKLSSSPSNHSSSVLNHNQPSSLTSTTSGPVSSGAISITFSGNNNNNRDSTGSIGQSSETEKNSAGTSPVSLPTWGAEKRSVKELAASLARHQSQQQEEPPKKKSDSLPRNVTSANTTVENQGLHAKLFML